MISHEKSVGAVLFRVVENKPLYLLLHYRSGHWDFPKGHMEKGETEHDTLKREVQEETGITNIAIISGFRELSHYFYKAKGEESTKRKEEGVSVAVSKDVAYFVTKTNEERVAISHEHKGYAWFTFEETVKRLTYKNGKDLIRKAHEFLLLTRGIF